MVGWILPCSIWTGNFSLSDPEAIKRACVEMYERQEIQMFRHSSFPWKDALLNEFDRCQCVDAPRRTFPRGHPEAECWTLGSGGEKHAQLVIGHSLKICFAPSMVHKILTHGCKPLVMSRE